MPCVNNWGILRCSSRLCGKSCLLHRFLAVLIDFLPSSNSAQQGKEGVSKEALDRHEKVNAIIHLQLRTRDAKNNADLGDLVAEFGKLTSQSRHKNITKNGLLFFTSLARRLGEMK